MYKTVSWKTGAAAARFRAKNKKIKKRVRAQARKRSSVFPTGNVNWFKKKIDRDQA